MSSRPFLVSSCLAGAALASTVACTGTLEAPPGASPARPSGAAGQGTAPDKPGATAGTGGSTMGMAGAAGGASVPVVEVPPVPIPTEPSFLPPRIRRLSNAEYDRAVGGLFGLGGESPSKAFAPDTRQNGYTPNQAQRVDPLYAAQIQDAAKALAKSAFDKVVAGQACAQSSPGEPCAQTIIAAFVPKAYRRPLLDAEKQDLLTVYKAGAANATFRDGLELVLTAVLQSASFLYVTELGDAPTPKAGEIKLTNDEIATALAFAVTGAPPDAELASAAAAGKLTDGAERGKQTRRLLATPAATAQLQRQLKEWTGIDRIEAIGKNNMTYPQFDGLRAQMAREADAFIAEVLTRDGASLPKLLAADYTVVEPDLGRFYGLGNGGSGAGNRSMLGTVPRPGLLNQSAFLSVMGGDTESAPVLRGAAVLKRILCVAMPNPTELNINVVPPPPDPKLTTRERFAQHAKDPACATCHSQLDPLGFAFEGFDGMGGARAMDHDKPVVTSTEVLGPAGIAGPVANSAELMRKIAASDEVRACFARQLFRFMEAASGEGYEKLYLAAWEKLAPAAREDLREQLVALVSSDLFITRKAP